MKNEGGQKILASIGTPPGWDWDLLIYQKQTPISISMINAVMYDLVCTLSIKHLLKKILNKSLASIGTPPG